MQRTMGYTADGEDMATLENNLKFSHAGEISTSCDPGIPLLDIGRNSHTLVLGDNKSKWLETTQMSTVSCTDK